MTKLYGSIPALITPMRPDTTIDFDVFEQLVQGQIDAGAHAVVPMGTTGESPTLSHSYHKRVIEACVSVVDKKIPVIAGTGSNCTSEAVELTAHAKTLGVDYALVVTPYYNKPNQQGLYQHFKTIATSVDLPIIIYDIPGRCGIKMENDTIARLSEELPDRIVGLKDATGNPQNTADLLNKVDTDKFFGLCGDDGLMQEFADSGSVGCISVSANVAPVQMAEMQNALKNKDMETFNAIQTRLMDLHNALFLEPNPSPCKYAMMRLGMIPSDMVRLPLVQITNDTKQQVDIALKSAGLL